jgi:hypothetical protein
VTVVVTCVGVAVFGAAGGVFGVTVVAACVGVAVFGAARGVFGIACGSEPSCCRRSSSILGISLLGIKSTYDMLPVGTSSPLSTLLA